ncbi:MAG: hypothetical protein AB7E09_02745 [Candidatus Izemoplasmatales bacterium]
MKKFRKPFKFYLTLFILSSVLIIAYSIFKMVRDDTPLSDLYSTWFIPLFFILIYWSSDWILDKIFNRKQKVDYESKFLDTIGQKMRDANAFLIEDYRRLQINQKFQASLKIAYKIYTDGEDDTFTIDKLEKKFKKDAIEYKAMQFVVDYLKENRDLNGKNKENKV